MPVTDHRTSLAPSGDALLGRARPGTLHVLPISMGSHTLSGDVCTKAGAIQLVSRDTQAAQTAEGSTDPPVRRSLYSWCLAGTHLVHADCPQQGLLHVSVSEGVQRVAGFSMPVAREQSARQLYATAHAQTIALILHSCEGPHSSQLIFCSKEGALLARHTLPPASAWDLSTAGRFMLALSGDVRMLRVCASTSSDRHAIELGLPPEVRP